MLLLLRDFPSTTAFDPAAKGTDVTLSNANLTATNATGGWESVLSTSSKTDKRYFEATFVSGSFFGVGAANASGALNSYLGSNTNGIILVSDSGVYYNATNPGFESTIATGDTIGIAVDPAGGTIKFNKNGGAFGASYSLGGVGGTVFAGVSILAASAAINLGARAFVGTVPVGYSAWDATVSPTTNISGSSSPAFSNSGTLAGKAALTGTSSPAFADSGTLLGKGALTGTGSPAFSNSGTIAGKGAMAGASSSAFSLSATITGKGSIAGTTAPAFVGSGTLLGLGALSGASSPAFAPSGALAGLGSLSGATASAFALSGTLSVAGSTVTPITASASVTFSAAATASNHALWTGTTPSAASWTPTAPAAGAWSADTEPGGTWTPHTQTDAVWTPVAVPASSWN